MKQLLDAKLTEAQEDFFTHYFTDLDAFNEEITLAAGEPMEQEEAGLPNRDIVISWTALTNMQNVFSRPDASLEDLLGTEVYTADLIRLAKREAPNKTMRLGS